jgi:organic radical activating enzyme
VQGEGPQIGTSTLFFRLGECDLRCRWCDTPHSWRPARTCQIETARGTGDFRTIDNPVSIADAMSAADALELSTHMYGSITGGEPLLQPGAVRALALAIRERGARVHLETHGIAFEALETVVDVVDVVSMDWKFVSDVKRASDRKGQSVAPFHDAHERFLTIAQRAPEVVVKLVVTLDTREDEIDEVCERVSRSVSDVSLVVQPVTPAGAVREAPGADLLLPLVRRIERRVPGVRLIPQTHKLYGAL